MKICIFQQIRNLMISVVFCIKPKVCDDLEKLIIYYSAYPTVAYWYHNAYLA